jgi:Fe-S cluster biogenesis protein NfuA
MTLQQRAEEALSGLREGFQADGADLELVSVDGVTARVRLVVTDETCQECIVPCPLLQQVLEAALRRECPEIDVVEVEDPREGVTGPQP